MVVWWLIATDRSVFHYGDPKLSTDHAIDGAKRCWTECRKTRNIREEVEQVGMKRRSGRWMEGFCYHKDGKCRCWKA